MAQEPDITIQLPTPRYDDNLSVASALRSRRSVREFTSVPVTLEEVGQLLWAAQGAADRGGYRTAPSAGALYPLEVYLVSGAVTGLDTGLYHYKPLRKVLVQLTDNDRRPALAEAASNQTWVGTAPAVLAIAAVYAKTARKYGRRANRYVHMEVGHAVQSVYLEAEALGLGTVIVGAFDDARVQRALEIPKDHEPLALMPVGHPGKPQDDLPTSG